MSTLIEHLSSSAKTVRKFFSVPSDKPDLVTAQHKAFQSQMPLLYIILLTNAWILSGSFIHTAPALLTLGAPIVLTTVGCIRVSRWWLSRGQETAPERARIELTRTNMLAWLLAVLFCTWALSLYPYGEWSQKMQIAFFMAITAVGCTFCLLHLRPAAVAVMVTCNLAFFSFFLSTGNATFVAMAINMVLVCSALLVILMINYRDFNALVESRQVLFNEQAKTLALSNENFALANRDTLTDLPNRRSFFAALRAEVARTDLGDKKIVLGIIDLDGFKPINDTYGHMAGDALLCQLADRLQLLAGGDIRVYRLGGDEFALLQVTDDINLATEIAEDICVAICEPFRLPFCTARISGTIGMAVYPDMAQDERELFENADYAMYRAKRGTGRGAVRLFSKEDEAEIKRCSHIEQALKIADLDNELTLMFQPIMDISTGRPHGFEALARWTSPTLGRVGPNEFIPIAERAGIISRITVVLMRKALAEAATWPDHMHLSFNLSVFDISSPDALLRITEIVQASGVDPARIELEITETAMVQDFTTFLLAVDTLKALGVGISLDDFGTGYSSLKQVHSLPLDKLKVDRTFVSQIDENVASQKIIKSLVALCNDLNLACVVEGVETEDELKTIRQLGCHLVQGYYYGRPMESTAITDFFQGLEEEACARASL